MHRVSRRIEVTATITRTRLPTAKPIWNLNRQRLRRDPARNHRQPNRLIRRQGRRQHRHSLVCNSSMRSARARLSARRPQHVRDVIIEPILKSIRHEFNTRTHYFHIYLHPHTHTHIHTHTYIIHTMKRTCINCSCKIKLRFYDLKNGIQID